MYFATSVILSFKSSAICTKKQHAYQYSVETADKFSNYQVKMKGQQGVFTPHCGLYLVLADWSRIDLTSGNYQVTHQFGTFYYRFCFLLPRI